MAAGPVRPPVRVALAATAAVLAVSAGIGLLLLLRGGSAPVAAPVVPPPAAAPTAPSAAATRPPTSRDPFAPGGTASPAPPPAAPPAAGPATSVPAPPGPAAAGGAPALPGATPARGAGHPTLTVLNNSRLTGLAAQQAARYRAAGWPVGTVGSLRGRVRATTVYYEPGVPGQQAQAQQLAADFGLPRVLPRLDGLPGSGLTVVVTRDLVQG